MSLAPTDSSTRSSLRSGWRRLAAVTASRNSASWRVDRALAGAGRFRRRAFARALRAEQAVGDGGAGAGERQIGHRDVRILHGERQRGAGLIAVERTVAGGIEPERALALPDRQRIRRFAGPSAFIAGAARAVILRGRGAEIGAEAEAFVGQRDRPVRIAFAGGDAVAEAGDEDVAHRDLGGDALAARRIRWRRRRSQPWCGHSATRRLTGSAQSKVDCCGPSPSSNDQAQVAPTGTGAGQPNRDGMIDRRQIAFLDVVAGAGLADAAGEIDAEPVHHVARPAAAVALQFQRLFGGEDAAAARAFGMQQEVALFAEQPEAVADLPRNLQRRRRARRSALPPRAARRAPASAPASSAADSSRTSR